MKKLFSAVLAGTMALAFGLTAAAEDDNVLVMATNAEFPPYEFHDTVDGEDKIVGIDAEVHDA